MPSFSRQKAANRELEEAVRRRIRGEPPASSPNESSAEDLVELIRALGHELKRRGIETREIRASANGFTVSGMVADRPIDEWYSARDVQRLVISNGRQ